MGRKAYQEIMLVGIVISVEPSVCVISEMEQKQEQKAGGKGSASFELCFSGEIA